MNVKSTEGLGKYELIVLRKSLTLVGKVPELISLKELFHEIAFDQNLAQNWVEH